MMQANMLEAKTELSKLVKMLETGQEDVVYIARNNVPVVQMTVVRMPPKPKRIGAAKDKFSVPDDFDAWDREVEGLFEGIS